MTNFSSPYTLVALPKAIPYLAANMLNVSKCLSICLNAPYIYSKISAIIIGQGTLHIISRNLEKKTIGMNIKKEELWKDTPSQDLVASKIWF